MARTYRGLEGGTDTTAMVPVDIRRYRRLTQRSRIPSGSAVQNEPTSPTIESAIGACTLFLPNAGNALGSSGMRICAIDGLGQRLGVGRKTVI